MWATTRNRFVTATTETVLVGFVSPAATGAAARLRTDCFNEDLHARRDRRRASLRSSHSASPRTPPKSKSEQCASRAYAAHTRSYEVFFANRCHHLLRTFWN